MKSKTASQIEELLASELEIASTFAYLDKNIKSKQDRINVVDKHSKHAPKRKVGRPRKVNEDKVGKLKTKPTKLALESDPELSAEDLLLLKEHLKSRLKEEKAQRRAGHSLNEDRKILWKPQEGFQTEALSSIEYELLLCGGKGPLAYGELVLTPNGFIKIEDVCIGDEVVTPNGEVAKVIDTPFDGEDECYEIKFVDGRKVVVGQDHVWQVVRPGGRKGTTPFLITTNGIIDYYEVEAKKQGTKQSLLVPLPSPSNGARHNETLPLDPYLLGLLLGDGCLSKHSVSLCTKDEETVEAVSKLWNGGITYNAKHLDLTFKRSGELKAILKELNLLGTLSNTKFVPELYLKHSVDTRKFILQGLLDTDGTVDTKGHVSFCSVSKQLALDVQYLVRSLGGKATLTTKQPYYKDRFGDKVPGQLAYILYIVLDNSQEYFRLTRKKVRCHKGFNGSLTSKPQLRITSVTPVGIKKCKCITIDRTDGLFITNDFIVTHNSGKSDTLVIDPLRWVYNGNFRGLYIRKTLASLKEIISRAKDLYPKMYPGTKWKDQDKIFEFPSGAAIEFGYLDHVDDYDRYHGRQWCWIGVDEIHQYQTDELYNKIKSVARKTDPNLPLRIRATCNPGGGHWIKEYWGIEGGVKDKKIDTVINTEVGPMVLSRRYLFSNVYDNKILLASNPEYVAYLHSLPEVLKRRYLEGDFEAAEGLAFPEFRRDTHVIDYFPIPNNWVKIRAIDWGYSSRSLAVCLWLAITPENDIICYRELSVNQMLAGDFARKILELSENEYISYTVVDGSIGDKRGSSAPTIDEEFREAGLISVYADKTPGSRVAGVQLAHKYLKVDETTGKPRLQITSNCKQIIKELSSLPSDPNNPEDVDTTCEDHAWDALKYGLMSRPSTDFNKGFDVDFFGYNNRPTKRGLTIHQPVVVDSRFGY